MEGLTIVKGIAFANAFILDDDVLLINSTKVDDVLNEKNKFIKAVNELKKDYKNLSLKNINNSDFLDSLIELLDDPMLIDSVLEKINNESSNINKAIDDSRNEISKIFENIDDDYIKGRIVDIESVISDLLAKVNEKEIKIKKHSEIILFSKNIKLSTLLSFDLSKVKAILSNNIGKTSHIAIIAKSNNIALSTMPKNLENIKNNDEVLLDAREDISKIKTSLNKREKAYYLNLINEEKEKLVKLKSINKLDCLSLDGQRVNLSLNISNDDELDGLDELNFSAIGLFRSEFIFNEDLAYNEDKQVEKYIEAYEKSSKRDLYIRTLDIGGDKDFDFLELEKEANPFLGLRGIRLSLKEKKSF